MKKQGTGIEIAEQIANRRKNHKIAAESQKTLKNPPQVCPRKTSARASLHKKHLPGEVAQVVVQVRASLRKQLFEG